MLDNNLFALKPDQCRSMHVGLSGVFCKGNPPQGTLEERVEQWRELIKDGDNTEIGAPTLKGASVTGTIVDHGRYKKILVYKKKRRKGYQRKNGHRQWFTEIEFNKITHPKNQPISKKKILKETLLSEEEE